MISSTENTEMNNKLLADLTELLLFTPDLDQLEIICDIPAVRDIIEKHKNADTQPMEPITREDLGVSEES